MGNCPCYIPPPVPLSLLACLPQNLKASPTLSQSEDQAADIFFCNIVWPQYQLVNGAQWPVHGTFVVSSLQDLDNYCLRLKKQSEIAKVWPFLTLCGVPILCSSFNPLKFSFSFFPSKSPLLPSHADLSCFGGVLFLTQLIRFLQPLLLQQNLWMQQLQLHHFLRKSIQPVWNLPLLSIQHLPLNQNLLLTFPLL